MESFQWNERKGWQTSHLHHVEGMQGQDRGQNNKYNWVSTSVPTEPSFLQMYFFLGVIHVRTEGEGVKKWPLFRTTVLIGSARLEVFLCQDPLTLLIVVILEGDQVTQSASARWSTTNAPADAKSSIVQTRTHCCGCTYRQTYSTVLRTFVRGHRQGGGDGSAKCHWIEELMESLSLSLHKDRWFIYHNCKQLQALHFLHFLLFWEM